ncbi:MAG: response regulator, partial [Thalassolituus sp.]
RMLQPGNSKVDNNDPHTWNYTVVRGLIRHMRGTLDIESLSNQGGSVTLFLPMRPDEESGNSRTQPDTSLTGLRVLVVDDNASLRTVIEKQLKRWGISTDSTYSGKEALAMLRTEHRAGNPYDMIIVDHDMPVMSGLQLAERIRSDEEIPHKPASLMLTGLSTNSVERSAAAAGIDYVIAKPASGNRLREALIILQKRRSSY